MWLESVIFALGFNILMFVPAFYFSTDKLTDLSYSLTFIALALYFLFAAQLTSARLFLSLMVLAWALRLGLFLFVRIHKQKKDDRFDQMRESFWKFLRFWLLQGISVWLILFPLIFFSGNFSFVGVLIWFVGLVIESIADLQKFIFKQNKKNKGKFISTGLWNYSRHPNYFGEILVWIGVYVASGAWWWGLVSPVYITLLLVFVSGIPLLEKKADAKWGKEKEYQEYKKRTSVLVPWFKK